MTLMTQFKHARSEIARTILPAGWFLKIRYRRALGRRLNLRRPERFTEKIQWSKLNELHKPIYTSLADKYAVRDWVGARIGSEHLIPLLGAFDSFDDIDFDSLPDRFVIKCNHDAGSAIVCDDKSQFDRDAARERINKSLSTDFGNLSLEPQYRDIPRKVLVEENIGENSGADLADYKFFCFDGVPTYCRAMTRRPGSARAAYYDMNWSMQPFTSNANTFEPMSEPGPRPDQFEEMKQLAARLAEGFSHVRVDLYNVNGRVYFGEMTFSTASGFSMFDPDEYDHVLGALWQLPQPA